MLDLVIRGGLVADGTGGSIVSADVGVVDGTIVEIGSIDARATRTIDADGALVTPGFVDTHGHYDGQVAWDPLSWSSSLHGTTTVVNGNCAVGFAPARAADRNQLLDLMEAIEEIPGHVLRAGIDWRWTTFDEYLDALGPHDIDHAFLVPHNALRVMVMGERATAPATGDEVAQMSALLGAALEAGAVGFSSDRASTHRTKDGNGVPASFAEVDELTALASRVAPHGVFQLSPGEVVGPAGERELELQWAIGATGATLMMPLVAGGDGVFQPTDWWEERVVEIDEMVAAGLDVWLQVAPRPVGVFLGLQATLNPFSGIPAYAALADLAPRERAQRMRETQTRADIVGGFRQPRLPGGGFQAVLRPDAFDRMWEFTSPPNYEPSAHDSLQARAESLACDPVELAYDIVTEGDGSALLYFAFFGYAGGHLDNARRLMLHPRAVVGLGDGGAHVGSVCDSSYPTTMLTHWVRDRDHNRLDLAWVVQSLTSRPAQVFGFNDRGTLAPGLKADINVIDLDRLHARTPRYVDDLPAGGTRLIQEADGFVSTIVSGVETYSSGEHTGMLPGRVVRHRGAGRRTNPAR